MNDRSVDVDELLQAFLGAGEDRRRNAVAALRGEAVVPSHKRGPLLMGMGEAATFLGVSRTTLWRMIQVGRIEKVEILPGSHRVRREDLERFVDDRN